MKKKPHDAIVEHLNLILQKFAGKSLNADTCLQVYRELFEAISNIATQLDEAKTKIKLSNEGVNYIAQQYYDCVTVNGKQILDPNVFSQRASLDNIPTSELVVILAFVNGSEFAGEVVKKIRSRS